MAARRKFEKVGREAALVAIDQIADLGLENSLESYFENLGDTLAEMGVRSGTIEVRDAHRGFEAVLVERNVSYRPHGL